MDQVQYVRPDHLTPRKWALAWALVHMSISYDLIIRSAFFLSGEITRLQVTLPRLLRDQLLQEKKKIAIEKKDHRKKSLKRQHKEIKGAEKDSFSCVGVEMRCLPGRRGVANTEDSYWIQKWKRS